MLAKERYDVSCAAPIRSDRLVSASECSDASSRRGALSLGVGVVRRRPTVDRSLRS